MKYETSIGSNSAVPTISTHRGRLGASDDFADAGSWGPSRGHADRREKYEEAYRSGNSIVSFSTTSLFLIILIVIYWIPCTLLIVFIRFGIPKNNRTINIDINIFIFTTEWPSAPERRSRSEVPVRGEGKKVFH